MTRDEWFELAQSKMSYVEEVNQQLGYKKFDVAGKAHMIAVDENRDNLENLPTVSEFKEWLDD